jgi:hypothetical protein
MRNQLHKLDDPEGVKREIVYFVNALAVDGFDISIRQVDDDPSGRHAIVELLFTQKKGTSRTEVVASLRLSADDLSGLADLIRSKWKRSTRNDVLASRLSAERQSLILF